MTNSLRTAMSGVAYYRIRVSGGVSEWWVSQYMNVKTLETHHGAGFFVTEITGRVTDQDALIGLLNMLYDMRHVLISVDQLTAEQYDEIAAEG